MAARNVTSKAQNSERTGTFAAGKSMCAPGTDQSAGGANLKKPRTAYNQSGGAALNKGRSRLPGSERHYNGGTTSIKQGSTSPSR